jgi:hypothetical protein
MQHPAITSCLHGLVMEIYTSVLSVKTGNLLLLFTILFQCFESTTTNHHLLCEFIDIHAWLRVTSQLLKSYWYSCVALSQTINIGNTFHRRFQQSSTLLGIMNSQQTAE